MKHVKTCLFLFVFFYKPLTFAQTDSLVDVMPLAVGNQWTYHYFVLFDDMINEMCSTDTGTVVVKVTNRIADLDSVRWTITQMRELIRVWGLFCFGYLYQIRDTMSFELVERLSGQHQIYRNRMWYHVFQDVLPFTPVHVDSTPIFRYRHVGPGDTVRFYSTPIYPGVPSTRCYFTFEKGVGQRHYESRGPAITGSSYRIDHQLINAVIVSVDPSLSDPMPLAFGLYQNYPNPFNPTTTITYSLPLPRGGLGWGRHVTLKVFDILGREVATLVNEEKPPGQYQATWDASSNASGVYFYRLTTPTFTSAKKLVLLQ